jgi:nucleotide-binding universal stress UspA family protein
MMFKTVVVPIDGSALSRQAVPVAAEVAAAGRAALRLVAVARDDGEREAHLQQLRDVAASLGAPTGPDLDVVVDPDPVRALLEIAADATNVLCFGSHDHTHPVAELLGSVGSKVAERSAHPFVIIGPNGAPATPGGDVVVALDGGDDPDPPLSTAIGWAAQLAVPLRLVTVYEPVPEDVRQPEHYTRSHGPSIDADAYLDAMRNRVEAAGVAGVSTAAIGDPVSVAEGLGHHLAERPALVLAVGGPHRHLWPSSLTRDLLRGTPPPVLVVPRDHAS